MTNASAGPTAAGRNAPDLRSQLRSRLRAQGLRWTPQRRLLVDVLDRVQGHVTGSELVEACRALDPGTTPSTVYRTLDVLEDLGVVSHSHGHDGREEYHVRPAGTHGHLVCDRCGRSWELDADEAEPFVRAVRARRGFSVEVGHLTIVGRCESCADQAGS